MKITDVQTKLLVAPITRVAISGGRAATQRDVLLVKVLTDEGITGESFLTGLGDAHGSEAPTIKIVIDEGLKKIILGEDPLNVERLWAEMYRLTRRFGRKGAVVRAISGVDIALWDIRGKRAGLSLHQMAGGFRDEMPVYISGGHYFKGAGIEGLIEEMTPAVERGFKGVKIRVGRLSVLEETKRVAALREALGPEMKIMVDANCAWDRITAMQMVRHLEPYNIFWMEEPISPDDYEGYAQLRTATTIPIAAGENEYTRYGFKELIARGCVDIIQPDVTRMGGVTEWLRVANVATTWGVPIAPHAVHEVHSSLVAAIPNGLILEFFNASHPQHEFLDQLILEPREAKVAENGFVKIQKKPGIGLTFNENLIQQYEVK